MGVTIASKFREATRNLSESKEVEIVKLNHKFTLTDLNSIIAFLYKDSALRTRKTVMNISRLLDALNYEVYKDNKDLQLRLWIIRKTVDIKLHHSITDDEYIKQMIIDDVDCNDEVRDIIYNITNWRIGYDESKHLIRKIDDILQFGYVLSASDDAQEIFNKIKSGEFKSYKSVEDNLYALMSYITTARRRTSSASASKTFSLDDEIFGVGIDESMKTLQDRNRTFITGMQGLNTLLAPGYISKRLYTYLALPGKGKSTILLKSALDIKRYNKGIQTKDPEKRPAVLFLTLENDIAETVERLYNMAVDSSDIRNYTSKQVQRKMREEGGLRITQDDSIDIIIKEYKNRELNTSDIRSIIADLGDEGIEVVALIVDYLKRLKPTEVAKDEKQELKNITNELKDLAKDDDIPVITAQQINRNGSGILEAAIQAKKDDATKMLGTDTVAGAWEIIENSDVVIIINPTVKRETDTAYMAFKLIKRRYRSREQDEKLMRLDYINQPFEPGSTIRLSDDIYLPKPLYVTSLASDLEEVAPRGKVNMIPREEKKKKKKSTIGMTSNIDDYPEFTFMEDNL